ncbi:spore coat protein [Cavenderia fasciculata]|uniref:Spore coat protein n=1 Tax=Cavenderia fasciculata TaxID=261658 RepID=F4PZQ5_CACFS|nr:spore coat protein [Cavenderia fasciculata]EGG18819.1 spore coat protein [Cavenderia fasciculata]|eukprot:XP_004357281.1 spore coat protein [Cavenderia fasciculata]
MTLSKIVDRSLPLANGISYPLLPSTITTLEIEHYDQSVKGALPQSLDRLVLYLNPSNTSVIHLPPHLTHLTLKGCLKQSWTSIFPQPLKSSRDNDNNNSMGLLPLSLTHLSLLVTTRNSRLDERVFPPRLTHLKFGDSFEITQIKTLALPDSLSYLWFGKSFNLPFGKNVLPPHLKFLRLGSEYVNPLQNLPKSIETLLIDLSKHIRKHSFYDVIPLFSNALGTYLGMFLLSLRETKKKSFKMENQNQEGTSQRASEFPPAESFPLSTPAQATNVDSQSLMEKEQNLMRWEQELRERERILQQQHNDQLLHTNAAGGSVAAVPVVHAGDSTYNHNAGTAGMGPHGDVRGPTTYQYEPLGEANYPSFFPVTRFAVEEDIPYANRRLVRLSAVTFAACAVALIWNFGVSIGALTIGAHGNFFVALFYMLAGIPICYFVHRRLYRAARTGEPHAQYNFLAAYMGLLAFNFIFWLGFKKSGMHGLIWMINLFHNDHNAVGALNVISLFFFTVTLILVAGIFFKVLRTTYTKRNTGEHNMSFKSYLKSR